MGGISDTLFCVVVLSDDGLVFVSDEKAREFLWSLSRRSDPVFTCRGTIDHVGLIDERSRFPEYVVPNLGTSWPTMEFDEPQHPVTVGGFGAISIVVIMKDLANLIHQPQTCASGRNFYLFSILLPSIVQTQKLVPQFSRYRAQYQQTRNILHAIEAISWKFFPSKHIVKRLLRRLNGCGAERSIPRPPAAA